MGPQPFGLLGYEGAPADRRHTEHVEVVGGHELTKDSLRLSLGRDVHRLERPRGHVGEDRFAPLLQVAQVHRRRRGELDSRPAPIDLHQLVGLTDPRQRAEQERVYH